MELIGKSLGNKYHIVRLLGEGDIGSVYQAQDSALQREVAIQVIHERFARQPKFQERFQGEARRALEIDYPGFVKVYDFGQHLDQPYIVMEYLRGANLRQLLDEMIQERKWLPLREAVLVVEQLCQTLEYTHQHGLLHRDIKPANLMLKPEPVGGLPFRVVLTDLGLARLLEGEAGSREATFLGTPAYMSPERTMGLETVPRSDVYSLGILLYELTVGLQPFPIKTITEAVRFHTKEPPPLPRSLRADLPEALEQVILKALAKVPNQRYQSPAELGTFLADVISDLKEGTELESQREVSLLTKYQESLIPAFPKKPAGTSEDSGLGKTELRPALIPGSPGGLLQLRSSIEVLSKGKKAEVFSPQADTLMIGRDPDNQLVILDPEVSRRHIKVTWDGANYYVTDLESRNGTFLGNTRLQPGVPQIWRPSQVLRIGDTALRLKSLAQPVNTMEGLEAEQVEASVTPQQLTVEAGESVTATIALLNRSPNPDQFSLSLTGIPNTWVSNLPSLVELRPGEHKEIVFSLQIPRTPENRAGRRSVNIWVKSQNHPTQSKEVKLALTIAAYSQFAAELLPQRLRAGQMGQLTITNQGNIQETFDIQFSDAASELSFQPPQLQLRVPEGQTATTEFQVGLRQSRWIGGEKSHEFSAQVRASKGAPQTLHADLLSLALIPIWVLPAALLLCLFFTGSASALWYFTHRSATLTVIKNGEGTVTSSPAGIDCGSTCSFDFEDNSTVTLIAAPLSPSTFAGWSGADCSGTSLTCDIKMSEAQTITATFNPPGSQTLIVNKTGTGSGTVTSSPAGIDCGSTCSYTFDENTPVTLSVTAVPPSTFGGWSGAGCTGTSLTCTVTMNAVQSVIATFNLPSKQTLTVNKAGTGTGTVSSLPAGINCGSTCSFDFDDNTTITLTANVVSPSTFGGWSGGGCSGTSLTCVVIMNANQNVTATFNTPGNQRLTVNKAGTGTGTVTSSPAGINCGSTCSFDFAFDAFVRLTAAPTPPSTFAGWSGAGCSGTSLTCDVKMNAIQNVTATFSTPGNQRLEVKKVGSGTVTSFPTGIDCGPTCIFDFAFDTLVRLTATPTAPSTFGGWSGGGCSGTSLTCDVRMNAIQTVTATFNAPGNQTLTVTVTKNGTSNGTVTSSPAGINNCGGPTCSFAFPFDTEVTLTANPISPSIFGGWSGAGCTGTGICKVKMNVVQNVTATFNEPSYPNP